ncbi:hypothetical protein QMO46_04290 [Microbacterium barkeri]|nr:hypothetical protein [Microbacterium barkeri]MDI6942710.1 hypothetical protein [Microbacterium barkeri]MDR6875130.1 hypothetical protein [Microbacterium barkeri]
MHDDLHAEHPQFEGPPPMRTVRAALSGSIGAWRWILAVAGLFVGLQALFLLLLVLAHSIPAVFIYSELATDIADGLWTTADHPSDGISHRGLSDAYTDCIVLTAGLSSHTATAIDPLWSALTFPHLGSCEPAVAGVKALSTGGIPAIEGTYGRYWGGFAVLTRPLLALGGIGAVRIAAVLLVGAAVAILLVVARRRIGILPAIALLTPVLVSTNFMTQSTTGFSHLIEFSIALLGGALGFTVGARSSWTIAAGGMVAGALFVFVDFLHNPPIAWMLFVFGAVAVRLESHPSSRRSGAKALIAATVSWLAGYGATWAARWMIGLASGAVAWDELSGKVSRWTSGTDDAIDLPSGPGAATKINAGFWLDVPTALPVALAVLGLLAWAVVTLVRTHDRLAARRMALLAAPALLAIVWLEALSGHSTWHAFFVYRALPMAAGVVAASAVMTALARRLLAARS